MSQALEPKTITVALIGNPNTGKSTVFNALAGMRQRVGNYPGVTVEKKLGYLQTPSCRFRIIDLPGTYSLAPRSPDEMVAIDVMLGRRSETEPPNVVLCIVDAANLERNLYLVSQVLELGKPVVVALNMTDVARERGMQIDVDRLRRQLGVPVVPLQANRRIGVEELKQGLAEAAESETAPRQSPFPEPFQQEVRNLEESLAERNGQSETPVPRYMVERLLLDTSGYIQHELLASRDAELSAELSSARARLSEAGYPVPAVEAMARYGWVNDVLRDVVTRPTERKLSVSDRIDKILTHRVWGTAIFFLLMAVVFQAVFSWAVPAMDLIDGSIGRLGEGVESLLSEGALRSLLVDGVIAGVGGVLVFLPQIFILFFFIALLEDCGYMARAAYLMDKLMSKVGLSGKSFIPLLSSFACAIPGVMATRVIENRRDRLTTILVAPLMSCSARLPVYTLLIAAFIPKRSFAGGLLSLQGLTMLAMYMVGIVVAVFVALLLKKTLLRGETPPFVMELADYKFPSLELWPLGVVWHRMLERGWAFIRRAGTIILAVSIVIWATLYYPRSPELEPLAEREAKLETQLEEPAAGSAEKEALQEQLAALEAEMASKQQAYSLLGRAGQVIEPVVRPLGWDWRIGSAAIASFPAREVVVATLGVIFNVGGEMDLEDEQVASRLHYALQTATWAGSDRPLFNVPVALSLMVFFALCAQCAATLAVIKRETNSWLWPLFTFTYMTVLAYFAAMLTYRAGMWLGT